MNVLSEGGYELKSFIWVLCYMISEKQLCILRMLLLQPSLNGHKLMLIFKAVNTI